jgi:hypothetical protein
MTSRPQDRTYCWPGRRRGPGGSPFGTGPRAALTFCAAMKSASLTSASCAGAREMTHPSGGFRSRADSGSCQSSVDTCP